MRMPYRLPAIDLQLICRWIEIITTGSANDIDRLLRNLIVDMLAGLLKLGHRAKDWTLVSRVCN